MDIINWYNLVTWYFIIINIIAIIVYGVDKLCALRQWWRVPELTLLLLAFMGGSIGALVAIQIFRHKTQHIKFRYGIPLIILLQLAGLVYIFWATQTGKV
ncbi:Uncharacterized membrane protein YsdA, DUF1294 family [Selenomonas sp. GACV-9]|uniref:DUF1294 domain-containing protein n=1 Tax=Selenomonas sp. GACV-9 TaxID=3158782 RepID=UPI0008E11D10|nr:Uncharacterized membrane protein YsdA, DUF1294 family [Selenomonas ruminantium]